MSSERSRERVLELPFKSTPLSEIVELCRVAEQASMDAGTLRGMQRTEGKQGQEQLGVKGTWPKMVCWNTPKPLRFF